MKVLVLDTETLGLNDRRIYDLGYLIYDTTDGNVLKMRDYIIKQVYDNKNLMNSAYYKKKLPIYEKRLADGYCKKTYLGTALKVLLNDIKTHKVDGIYAYNSKFDELAIADTCKVFGKDNPLPDGILDIMDYIEPITQTDEYEKFCRKNNYLTKHRPPRAQKKAETLYRYLLGQTDYEEEHTALEDSKIELNILMVALGYSLV